MKRSYIYGLLLSFLLGSSLYAQRAEYWLDSDPGRGKATALTLSGNDGSLTLNTASLSAGIHVVGIRTAQGRKWGQTYTHTFFVPHGHGSGTLNGVEWWLDEDPGRGQATAIAATGSDTQVTIPVLTDQLSAGVHTIGVRARQDELWGQTYTHTFFVPHGHGSGTLNGVEWWLDEDPGRGQATAIAATGSDTQVTIPVLTDQLAAGVHTIGVRARQDELWGQTYTHTFFVPHGHGSGTLNGVEWWLDEDPGRGQATTIAATGSDTQVTIPVPTDQLSEGVHTLGVRARQDELWGQTYTHTFVVLPGHGAGIITAAEWWLDEDPGRGKATPLAVSEGAEQLTLPVPTGGMTNGTIHVVGVRVRQNDIWGQTYTHSFLVTPGRTVAMTVQAVEAYFDYDLEHAFSIPFTQVGDSVVIENYNMPTTALTNGKHVFNLRAKADGKWSVLNTYEFCKNAQPAFVVDNTDICEGLEVYFSDLTAGADDNTTFAWDINGDGKTDYTDGGGIIHTYAKAGTYTVTLTVKNGDGCEASFSQEIVVNSAAAPSVTLTMNQTFCEGTEVTMTATPTNAGTTPQYEWLRNNVVIGKTGEPTFSYSQFANGDKVAVRLTASNPCTPQPVVTSAELTMTVYALPEITLTFPDAIYTDAGMITLAGYATPTGGKFYLDGQNKTFFNAATVGIGEHTLRYMVKNSNNCESEQTMTFTVSERPKYTITFVDDDGITVLQQSEVALDAMPTPPADPTKEATAEFTYTFAGWSPTIVAATGAATYTATYTATVNKYLITFVDEDGTTVLASAEYDYGTTPVAPADPTKEATAQYTYTFAGWDKEIVAVTGAATYTASYTATVNKYLITFLNDDESVLCAEEWEYGATPSCEEPTKEADEQYTYLFAGWQPEIVAVTGVATYIATYNAMTTPTALPANEQLPCPTKIIDNGLLYILLPDGTRFSAIGVKVE